MKFLIPGGSGQVGRILTRALLREGHECVVLSRHPARTEPGSSLRSLAWDGRTLGAWTQELEDTDVVINLAGRTVDCRYSPGNLREMMRSRVESTRVVGQAIAAARVPPRVWLQASTATIYAHRFDRANDEASGIIGGHEPDAPKLWGKSVDIALAWEAELAAAVTPRTRKVALRSAVTMSPDGGGVFSVLANLCRFGVGQQGNGRQYVSWMHEYDFVAAVRWIVAHDDLSGAVNLCSPFPLPNREFMGGLQAALGGRLAFRIPEWALEVGAVVLRTETELILKSRRVVPGRLLEGGFAFTYPEWPAAATELARRWRA
ncbi:MAG: epimerase [Verrucomicrobia bacterium]|nr:epimerase [Verrucomicrobiota bacterium]